MDAWDEQALLSLCERGDMTLIEGFPFAWVDLELDDLIRENWGTRSGKTSVMGSIIVSGVLRSTRDDWWLEPHFVKPPRIVSECFVVPVTHHVRF